MDNFRDYKAEHKRRVEKKKRLLSDVDKNKAESLETYLNSQKMTYSNWLNIQIDKTLKGDN